MLFLLKITSEEQTGPNVDLIMVIIHNNSQKVKICRRLVNVNIVTQKRKIVLYVMSIRILDCEQEPQKF